jgi:hypothetical protein
LEIRSGGRGYARAHHSSEAHRREILTRHALIIDLETARAIGVAMPSELLKRLINSSSDFVLVRLATVSGTLSRSEFVEHR